MDRSVTVTYLEMTRPAQLVPFVGKRRLKIRRSEVPSPELSRFLYETVGSEWWWHERLSWTRDEWIVHLERPEHETWIGYLSGTPAGYFELEAHAGNEVEIAYFGLLPAFIGQGLGPELLTYAVGRAWELGPERVWLHTCSLDHPRALSNYEARGFTAFRSEESVEQLPDRRRPLWPEGGEA